MTVIEWFSSQLDKVLTEGDLQYFKNSCIEQLDFWNLCLEARRLLIDEKLAKGDKLNASHNG